MIESGLATFTFQKNKGTRCRGQYNTILINKADISNQVSAINVEIRANIL